MSSTWVKPDYHLQVRRDASVHRQEAVVDDAGQRKQVERVHKHVVNLLVIFVKTLRAEVEEVSHLSALVIASDKRYCVWKCYL